MVPPNSALILTGLRAISQSTMQTVEIAHLVHGYTIATGTPT